MSEQGYILSVTIPGTGDPMWVEETPDGTKGGWGYAGSRTTSETARRFPRHVAERFDEYRRSMANPLDKWDVYPSLENE